MFIYLIAIVLWLVTLVHFEDFWLPTLFLLVWLGQYWLYRRQNELENEIQILRDSSPNLSIYPTEKTSPQSSPQTLATPTRPVSENPIIEHPEPTEPVLPYPPSKKADESLPSSATMDEQIQESAFVLNGLKHSSPIQEPADSFDPLPSYSEESRSWIPWFVLAMVVLWLSTTLYFNSPWIATLFVLPFIFLYRALNQKSAPIDAGLTSTASTEELTQTTAPPLLSASQPQSASAGLSDLWNRLLDKLPAPLSRFIREGNPLVQAGALVLFLGLAFLLRYVAERTQLPIEFRYLGVGAIGFTLLGIGWRLREKKRGFALILQGLAIGVNYLIILSAMKIHHLIDPPLAFAFLFAVSVLSALLAVRQNALTLAIMAAITGFLAPVLASTGTNNPIGLFSYLAVLDVGIALIAWFRAWRSLNVISATATLMLASAWGEQYYTDDQYLIAQGFLIFFAVLFSWISVFYARKTLQEKWWEHATPQREDSLFSQANTALQFVGRVDSALVFGVPIATMALQYLLLKNQDQALALSALGYGIYYITLALFIREKGQQGLALLAESLAIIAVIFGTLAIPLGLEGKWTGAAWVIEGAGIYWLGIRQSRPYARLFSFLVLFAGCLRLLHELRIDSTPALPLLEGSLLGSILATIAFWVVWWLSWRTSVWETSFDEVFQSRPIAGAVPRHWSTVLVDALEWMCTKLLPWFATMAFLTLPWLIFTPHYAALASAIIGLILLEMAGFSWENNAINVSITQPLIRIAHTLQAFAVLAFVFSWQSAPASGTSALAQGFDGAIVAVGIALTLIFTVARKMNLTLRHALAENRAPQWGIWQNFSVGVGVLLLAASPWFVMTWRESVLILPWLALPALFAGLYYSHRGLILSSGLITMLSGLFQLFAPTPTGESFQLLTLIFSHHFELTRYTEGSAWQNAFFAGSVTLAFTGLAQMLSWQKARVESPHRPVGFNAWVQNPLLAWIMPLWAIGWSLYALIREVLLWCWQNNDLAWAGAGMVAMILIVSWGYQYIAKRWSNQEMPWLELSNLVLWTLPLLILSAIFAWNNSPSPYLPLAHGGVVWWVALVWHCQLILRSPFADTRAGWIGKTGMSTLHLLGLWFFVALFSQEISARLEIISDKHMIWQTVGLMVLPLLTVALFSRPNITRMPWIGAVVAPRINTYHHYGIPPIIAFIVLWLLFSLFSSGNANPLPFVPLLNPLELVQWSSLLALVLWLRKPNPTFSRPMRISLALLAFLVFTAMILRACHQWGGVNWSINALSHSWLAQAALSIAWSALGVIVMLASHRRFNRTAWMAGAGLLGMVVIKLFVVDLAEQNGFYRIISFMVVGMLMLGVGYFAPIPPTSPPIPPPIPSPIPPTTPASPTPQD